MRRHLIQLLAVGVMVLSAGGASADLGDQLFELLPSDGAAEDRFGTSVSISGNIRAVGTPMDDDNGIDSGSTYLFVSFRAFTFESWIDQVEIIVQ